MPEAPYYLRHFHELTAHVEAQCPWLPETEEGAFLDIFRGLPMNAQALYLRLANRVPTVFRTDKLNYRDLDLPTALDTLLASGLLRAVDTFSESLLDPFTVPELKQLLPGGGARRRADWLALVLDAPEARQAVMAHPFVEQRGTWEYGKWLYLYFGNVFQTLSEFVVHELGHVRVEARPVERTRGRFASRAEADDGWLVECTKLGVWIAIKEDKDLEAALALWREWRSEARTLTPATRKRADNMANQIGRALERAGRNEEALAVYRTAIAPPSRERRARIHRRLGNASASRDVAHAMLEAGTSEEQQFASDWLARLEARPGRFRREATRVLKQAAVLELPPGPGSIEQRTAEALMAEGAERHLRAWHVENHLWSALFGLALWEVIFDPDAGFANPHQAVPEALWTSVFFAKRSGEVERALADLSPHGLLARWKEKQGTWSPFTHGSPWLQEAFTACVEFVPVDVLRGICRSITTDPATARRGFPDLFIVEERDGAWQAWAAEVKGPGDTLSDMQVFWLRRLNELGLRAEVLRAHPLPGTDPGFDPEIARASRNSC